MSRNIRHDDAKLSVIFFKAARLSSRPQDRRGVSVASFYVLSVRLTILIWTVLPAPYRYTGQVPLHLISGHPYMPHARNRDCRTISRRLQGTKRPQGYLHPAAFGGLFVPQPCGVLRGFVGFFTMPILPIVVICKAISRRRFHWPDKAALVTTL